MTKVMGDDAIDRVIATLEKKFSREFISQGPNKENVKTFSTGSLTLDIGLGIGGWPVGRVIEAYGLESSGKTSLGLLAMSQFQKNQVALGLPEYCLVVDAEHTMTKDLFNGFGLDMTKVIFVSPESAREALQSTMDLVKTSKIGFVLFDSIDTLLSDQALEKDIGEADVGGISKTLNRFFREYAGLCSSTGCTSYFINQLKYNPGARMGTNPETTTGGTALRYYSSIRLRLSPAKPSPSTPGAFIAHIKVKKNKCCPPRESDIIFDFIYGQGPDEIKDVLNAAKDLGVLIPAGQSTKIVRLDGTEEQFIKTGGGEGFREACLADPSKLKEVRDLCLAKL